MIWQQFSKILHRVLPSRIKEPFKTLLGVPSIKNSLINLKSNDFEVLSFIDCGAYKGEFSLQMKSIWPESKGFMIEANLELEEFLKVVVQNHSGLNYKIALLDEAEQKEVPFYLSETASSVLQSHHSTQKPVFLNARTLDKLLEAEDCFNNVDLFKLDVQGFELQVLKGGTVTLNNSKAVLLEVSLLDIYVDTPLVKDVIDFMYDFNFVLYDICSTDIRRPLDNALWQSDFLFVKSDSILRSKKSYR
jgi:FkbM family methyltransferase